MQFPAYKYISFLMYCYLNFKSITCLMLFDLFEPAIFHFSPIAFPCYPNEFKCSNGYCVPDNQQCDGYNDCADNSDETGCSKIIYSN